MQLQTIGLQTLFVALYTNNLGRTFILLFFTQTIGGMVVYDDVCQQVFFLMFCELL
jgi:hypothetical protein